MSTDWLESFYIMQNLFMRIANFLRFCAELGDCWVRSNPLLSKVSFSVKNPIFLQIIFVRVEYF